MGTKLVAHQLLLLHELVVSEAIKKTRCIKIYILVRRSSVLY